MELGIQHYRDTQVTQMRFDERLDIIPVQPAYPGSQTRQRHAAYAFCLDIFRQRLEGMRNMFQRGFVRTRSLAVVLHALGDQIDDTACATGAIDTAVDAVLAANADKVAQYKAGAEKLFGFFVGQVMKAMAGKGNPALVNEALKRKLS